MLATNVAETSLTVPGIKYVIDPGLRPHQPVQPADEGAAAADRARSARPAPTSARAAAAASATGVCVRLYSEEDFRAGRQFTDPEILRTNLASVILQMKALRLGDVQMFPFLEPPDYRAVATASERCTSWARSTTATS